MPSMDFKSGTLKITGVKDFISVMTSMGLNVGAASKEVITIAALHLEGKLKKRLSRSGTGKLYKTGRKGKRYKFHRASAPGEAPAVMFNRLRGSITHNVTGRAGSALPNPGGSKYNVKGQVGTNVSYGYFLERGTRTMQPRPWFMLTVTQEMPRVLRIITDGLRDYIRANSKPR